MSTTSSRSDINVCYFFREERKRLNLNQTFVADFLKMSPKQIGRWESSTAIPTDKLSSLVELGFDVQYVVTGQRSNERLVVHENVGLDSDVLADAIETVSNIFERIKRKPKSNQQLAQIISAVYELQLENGNSDSQQETILRLIKAAS